MGVTGIRLLFNNSGRTGALPAFRVFATVNGVRKTKTFGIARVGYDTAWSVAVNCHAELRGLSELEKSKVLKLKPGKALCRKLRTHYVKDLGYDIPVKNMKKWDMW
jgi:hypothetical protein